MSSSEILILYSWKYRSDTKYGNSVFDMTKIANDLNITVNEVIDHLQQLKVCLNRTLFFLLIQLLSWCSFSSLHPWLSFNYFVNSAGWSSLIKYWNQNLNLFNWIAGVIFGALHTWGWILCVVVHVYTFLPLLSAAKSECIVWSTKIRLLWGENIILQSLCIKVLNCDYRLYLPFVFAYR